MKLKPILTSMLVLGVSAPAMAREVHPTPKRTQVTRVTAGEEAARLEAVRVDQDARSLTDRNQPGVSASSQDYGWANRIRLSGLVNVDGYFANRSPIFWQNNKQSITGLALSNANLFVKGLVNDWVTADMSLVYSGVPSGGSFNSFFSGKRFTPSRNLFSGRPLSKQALDTAYVTISDFSKTPVYFRVGRAYLPFGAYQPYGFGNDKPVQLLSETNVEMAQLGLAMSQGFYGSIYAFKGYPRVQNLDVVSRIEEGGINIGYQYKAGDVRAKVDAGYLTNLMNSNFLSSLLGSDGMPNKRAPAYNINAGLAVGPFDVSGQYISLGKKIPFTYVGIMDGRKLGAWGMETGYTFPVNDRPSRVAVGYQQTSKAAQLLPKCHYYAQYMVEVAKQFGVGVSVWHNKDYAPNDGSGTGRKATAAQLHMNFQFA